MVPVVFDMQNFLTSCNTSIFKVYILWQVEKLTILLEVDGFKLHNTVSAEEEESLPNGMGVLPFLTFVT